MKGVGINLKPIPFSVSIKRYGFAIFQIGFGLVRYHFPAESWPEILGLGRRSSETPFLWTEKR